MGRPCMECREPSVGIHYLLHLRGTYICMSNVPSMVGFAAMVMLPLGADNFGRVLLVLRMDG